MNDNYNKGFGGLAGDRTDFDHRRGEYDRSKLLEGRDGGGGGGGGGGPGGGGGGIVLLALLPIIAIVAVSVVTIGGVVGGIMVVVLNLLPGHSRVAPRGAMKLGMTGALGVLAGLALSYAVVSLIAMAGPLDYLWLLVPMSNEVVALASSAPLLTSLLGASTSLPPVPVELPGLILAKLIMWAPAVLMFAKVYANNASFNGLPRNLLFVFGAGLAVASLSVAFPIAGWIADRLVEHFAFFTDRAVVSGFAATLGFTDTAIAAIPASWALAAYAAGGAIAGIVFVALSQAYKGGRSARGFVGGAFKWGLVFLVAGALTLLVMAWWPAADGLVAWASDAAMPARLRELAAMEGIAIAAPDLFSALPGFLIASLPAIALLTWAIHMSGLFRKNAAHDVLIAALMAVWPLVIIGPVAAVFGLGQFWGMFGAV